MFAILDNALQILIDGPGHLVPGPHKEPDTG